MEDEIGTGSLEFQKLGEKAASEHMWFSARPATSSNSKHVEQLLIDLHNAHEENKQLREDLARKIEKSKRSRYDCGVIALLAIVITYAVCMTFSVATK